VCYNWLTPRPKEVISYSTPPSKGAGTVPEGLVESLERSKAQVEAGLSVPLEPALDRLRASIARMKSKRAELEFCFNYPVDSLREGRRKARQRCKKVQLIKPILG